MKRLVCIFLALLLGAVSCGNDNSNSGVPDQSTESGDTTAPEIVEKDRLTELGEKDFDGKVFTILDANDHPDIHINMPGESENGDIINDALYKRDKYIEDTYNVDIQYIQIHYSETGTTALKNSVLANDDEYSLCIASLLGNSLNNIALEGVLANLNDMPYLSLGENWWSSLMYDSLRFDDKMYYTTGDISPTMYQMPVCVYLNTTLAENFGINENFPQLVRDGKWTWDMLEKFTKDKNRDVNEDNKMDTVNDFCGFANQGTQSLVSNAWMVSAGVDLSSISKDGSSIEINVMNEHTLSAIEKFKKVIIPDLVCDSSEYNDIITKMFKEDRALFLQHYVESSISYLRDMDSDYLILPFPKYDEDQESYRSFCNAWVDAFVAVPATGDTEFIGFITEAMAYYSYKNVRPQTYNLMLKQKAARDEDSTEMLDYIFNTLYLDFNCIYDFGGTATALGNVVGGKGELASEYAKIESKIDAEVEKFIENWKNN
ncbi:MAG: hypothetical protein HFE63_01980 [Clostridiales bacterium]|nr:hypothetical protein [Clostridiales bacterium]